jgi:hypothetical protein
LRILKKKILDDISRKLDKAEEYVKEIEEINISAEENEKLQRFGLYHAIRMEKFIREGGNPDFGNLDATEQTAEEFEYHLSHMLNDFTPEERYRQKKQAYYFHPSYIEMEKLNYWKDRARAKYCNGQQCIINCLYYKENGRIEDEQVIEEFIGSTTILEIEDYRKELGEKVVDPIIKIWRNPSIQS